LNKSSSSSQTKDMLKTGLHNSGGTLVLNSELPLNS
jgi:hypothetical protein